MCGAYRVEWDKIWNFSGIVGNVSVRVHSRNRYNNIIHIWYRKYLQSRYIMATCGVMGGRMQKGHLRAGELEAGSWGLELTALWVCKGRSKGLCWKTRGTGDEDPTWWQRPELLWRNTWGRLLFSFPFYSIQAVSLLVGAIQIQGGSSVFSLQSTCQTSIDKPRNVLH